MYSMYLAFALAILCLDSAILARAGLFIIQPSAGSVCKANQECTITWVDDGIRPLVSDIGVSTVGLYTGKQQLVQSITPINVAAQHSVTFKPIAAAGPNSDAYYIAIISTKFEGNDSIPYSAYSPFFTLTGMTGSFASPLPEATSTIPIPSSLTRPSPASTPATITVGTLSTAVTSATIGLPPPLTSSSSRSSSSRSSTSSSASSSRFSTVISPTPSPSPSSLTSASQTSDSSTPSTASSSSSSSIASETSLSPSPSPTPAQTNGSVQRFSSLSMLLPALVLAFSVALLS
ncbi:hypothetical protein CVT26_004225 [Gymnopilus dilepis]|uniref:Yeast cell wall synthesis Kre9/Knh1-like N-terminal domain-containing protein n=1 Tax=Gymnopilus dilepis TaxID=231916 RepID=A0A409YMP8_9AGAR|nr:hypothetical protein CVT26_004225 [Gymnopilus dilepis]